MLAAMTRLAIFPLILLSASAAQAMDLSALTRPGVTWQTGKAKSADVTCDGKADTIVFGTAKDSVWVGILPGNGGKPQTMRFGLRSNRQDGFCAEPERITTSPISCSDEEMGKFPGCKVVKGCRDFTVEDNDCDSFHFYWDASKKMVRWWRR
jgi:hypothetical protein